ncbi:hypothetical protein GO013_07240 [Pseudodesulfovibrio sp. JC047]|uniref:hypothetical protein n=1 Tax=Pseudodesulfovibrio sp. JC047 TaxID=2683199 RepID=UPI0013D54609|nr:hypothetical protein [Pseudodesulfovibrio sp. JC047]NDV19212.1 hypothetical protein [Pseudodesulfovibrio sp. JC047]
MFDNLIRVIGKGKAEYIQHLKLWDDLDVAKICISELPDSASEVTLNWLKTTDWYKSGGWSEIREAAYGPIGEQMDMLYHGTWAVHVEAVKTAWPKRKKE